MSQKVIDRSSSNSLLSSINTPELFFSALCASVVFPAVGLSDISDGSINTLGIIFLGTCFLMVFPTAGFTGISFVEVTAEMGIDHTGTTYGASWGDFDADGWPDLWVGNHNTKPILYLNKKGRGFEDIIDRVWSADPKADTHGAAWADFDNDGDQDLVELVDVKEMEDGTFSSGIGKNHLFVNDSGKLWQRAADYGLDHQGNARSPLWFDADRDGRLDLLVVNMPRRGQPGSKVYLQKDNRFIAANERLGFTDDRLDWLEKIRGRMVKVMDFSYPSIPVFWSERFLEFAQLAELSSDGYPDLILYSKPSRVYAIGAAPFENITHRVKLPDLTQISDVAVADFDGDRRMDFYAARGTYMPSDVFRVSPSEIKGYITCCGTGSPKAVHFKATGEIRFRIFPTWLPLSKIYIGATGKNPTSRSFTLSPEDADVYGPVEPEKATFDGASISYEPESRTWTIRNFSIGTFTDFNARASESITDVEPVGFDLFKEEGVDALFLRREDGFEEKPLEGAAGGHTSCYYVTAGDFDNDMDVDLYLTCTGPVKNLPNRLLENDGTGRFTAVPAAGGAAGSSLGRADVVAAADYDRDGFLDLFVTNGHDPTSPLTEEGPHQLFRNRGNRNHWLEIDLEGVQSNRDGIGARVEIETNKIVQVREQSGGMHRITQNHQRLHFGLGQNSRIDRVTVIWPSGVVQHLEDIGADQILHIKEVLQSSN